MTEGYGVKISVNGGPACPHCSSRSSRTVDSRAGELGSTRRRRICQDCKKRFTTYETCAHPGDRGLSETQKKILRSMLGTLAALVKQLAP